MGKCVRKSIDWLEWGTVLSYNNLLGKRSVCGEVAQLGERGIRIAEVGGSSPLFSTIFYFPAPFGSETQIS